MKAWSRASVLAVALCLVTGCLPTPIGDPATSTIDPALEGAWLARGHEDTQCRHGDVEYGPGTQQTICLVKAFDEHCYVVTAIDYYMAADGRIGAFGPGGAGLSCWRAWLADIGDRRYLVTSKVDFDMPREEGSAPSSAGFYPTFQLDSLGPDSFRLTPLVLIDILKRLEGLPSNEERAAIMAEYTRESLETRIRDNPDAAAPGDPRPIDFRRMHASSHAHVQQVLEAFHLADPLRRPKHLQPSKEIR